MNYQTAISHLKALGCEINGGYIISDGFRFGRIGEETRAAGEALIEKGLLDIPLERTREITRDRLQRIENGERDFRF